MLEDDAMKRSANATNACSQIEELARLSIRSWDDIHHALDSLPRNERLRAGQGLGDAGGGGIGFLTFSYGIDGVTLEIAKYGACLEQLLAEAGHTPTIHCIGGTFSSSADQVLVPRWVRHVLPGANGWSKWGGGQWFSALFHEDMREGSAASARLAEEIWGQAVQLARRLIEYVTAQELMLLVTVNINSNPGNPALALASVLASELMGVPVLNSSHDFFWEDGKPASARAEGEALGARDHFFRNRDNRAFFRLLERIYPWNGSRWFQLVINALQRDTLVSEYGFRPAGVLELGTFIEDEFFTPRTSRRRRDLRSRLSHILGHGERVLRLEAVDDFMGRLDDWMHEQTPVILSGEKGTRLELNEGDLWILQPTRVVTRKRIERDWDLIGALFLYQPFRAMFEENIDLTLTLHVTGPVPIEHAGDIRRILERYQSVVEGLPAYMARRVHLAFSVGTLGHSTFQERNLQNLTVPDLYHLSDLVLLPSSTEGRGLPILESAAAGLPLVCSEYNPREVFEKVVGLDLEPAGRIEYSAFPEGEFSSSLLQDITDSLFLPAGIAGRLRHNRQAVAGRFSMRDVRSSFETALERLADTPGPLVEV